MQDTLKKKGQFEYIEEGEGPVILILHGLFGALSNFVEVVPYFAKKGYKVVIPILPLYTLPVINTNVKNLSKFLRDFIEYKGYEKVNLLGNSLGGHVALVYALQHQDRVDQLILTGSSGLYEKAFGDTFPRREDKEW